MFEAIQTPDATESPATAASAKPTRICAECGKPFSPGNRPGRQFCCPAHKTAFQNRAAVEGRAIIALAKAWRVGRNTRDPAEKEISSCAMSELCTVLDTFLREDREAGRPGPLPYAKSLLANGVRYIDRRR